MTRRGVSFSRIIPWSAFLSAALLLALSLWHLPDFLEMNEFRPDVVRALEENCHCKVMVGNIQGELLPYPGLAAGYVVFWESTPKPRVLAYASTVHFGVSWKSMAKHGLHFRVVRFAQPRFFIRRELGAKQDIQWVFLGSPGDAKPNQNSEIKRWEVRNGTLEVLDETTHPTTSWVFDRLDGFYRVGLKSGELSGRAPAVGAKSSFIVHYDTSVVHAQLRTGAWAGMTVTVDAHGPGERWDMKGYVRHYQAQVVRPFFDERWVNGLSGPGSIDFSARSGSVPGGWHWTATGTDFGFGETDLRIDEWTAEATHQTLRVHVAANTPEGGIVQVNWAKPSLEEAQTLRVEVASVTVRQILQVFDLEAPTPNLKELTGGTSWNPHGYEPWRLTRGSMNALVHPGVSIEVQQSSMDIAGMQLDLKGTFGLAPVNPQARIQGALQNIAVAPVVESFFAPPAPISGTGQLSYTLAFPLTASWIQGLSGTLQVQVNTGILRFLKTFYRITSVLNLGTYFRFRFPKLTAQGIAFETVTGHLTFQNGVVSAEDLFLKSPSMNLGAKGSVDIPGARMDAKLRIELFRFLEDVLKVVPITHWIFRKPTKILFPLVVTVVGPWDNVDID